MSVDLDLGSDEKAVGFVAHPIDPALVRHLDSHHHLGGIDPQEGYLLRDDGDSHHAGGWGCNYRLDGWDIDRRECIPHWYNRGGWIDPVADCD